MIDTRQVMYDIERCISHVPDACRDCSHYTGTVGFGCMENLMSDALALLKEQEAKCLTKAELDDLNENQFVWLEERSGIDLYCLQIIEICRGRTGVSDIQFNTPTCYIERSTDTYGKDYRIWTDKPTEEQSQAVKWE